MSTEAIELKLNSNDENITLKKFWKMADDLFYTKVYYDVDTHEYFTKHYRNALTESSIDNNTDNNNDSSDEIENEDTKNIDDDVTSTDSQSFDLEVCTEDEINTLLVSFITLTANYLDPLIAQVGEEKFFNLITEYLMHFKYYQNHVDFCIRKMLSLLVYSVELNLNNLQLNVDTLNESTKDKVNEDINTNEKFIKIIGWIFYKQYQHDKKVLLESLKDYNGFITLCKVLQNYIAISKTINDETDMFGNSYKNYIKLTFDLCKTFNFSNDLSVIDSNDIIYLFDNLKVEARDENEINFLKFRLLLALNEQYMFQCGLKLEKDNKINYIVDVMIKKISYFQVFNETLVLNFNREMDRVDQILMLKFLYVVFSNNETNNLVYLNDLKVIVDIIIRQLFDLQLSQSEYLVNIYIRVLHCILTKTELKDHHYKREEINEVLDYLISSEDATEKTKNLAKKCLDCNFFSMNNISSESLSSLNLHHHINHQHDRNNNMSDKEILHKIGQETTHAFLNPASTLIGIPTNIMQHVARAPGVIISTPYKMAHNIHLNKGKISLFDSESETDSTPPPPPPRISHKQKNHITNRNNDDNINTSGNSSEKKINLSSLQTVKQPPPPPRRSPSQQTSQTPQTSLSATISPAPTPPLPRPFLRNHNASANDINIIDSSLKPQSPLGTSIIRRGSFNGTENIKSASDLHSSSPLPPLPPPRSRIGKNKIDSNLYDIHNNNTGSNDSEIQRNSGTISNNNSHDSYIQNQNNLLNYRNRNERTGSNASINSILSSDIGDVSMHSNYSNGIPSTPQGRQQKRTAPLPPPRVSSR